MDTFDPSKQSFDITTANGAALSINVSSLDRNYHEMFGISINYGSQIGASFIMLIVVLTLNPKVKFFKMCTILHIASLISNIIRMVLLSIYFPSKWTEFYTMFSGDYSRITETDMRNSVAGTISSYIVVVFAHASLIVQSWTIVKPWSLRVKWIVCTLSLAVCLTTIGFRLAFCIFQVRATLAMKSASDARWVAGYSIILDALSICCFCALFNVQLVTHLVKHGKFLPSKNGIKPFEVLIMANGLLMIIPGKLLFYLIFILFLFSPFPLSYWGGQYRIPDTAYSALASLEEPPTLLPLCTFKANI